MSAGPAHRVQSAVVEYGYPQGHLGHLSDEEEAAFKNFKVMCAEKGYFKAGEGEDLGTHDDATLLRFLRARRFQVADAFKQFADTEDWRKANHLDTLYETIDQEHYEETRRLYPQWTGRRDRRGIPVYVFEVKHLNAKTMAAYEKSAKDTVSKAETDGKTPGKLLRLFALYENLTRFVMPLCTALTDREHPRTPITQSNNIVDISGVGLKQFWNLRGHMQDASTLATAHYPETLDRIFIIGAPSFFPTVWGWIKKWFDPITTSKIFIISNADMQKTLESFIDPANIPVKYGGLLEFKFGDTPILDPAMEHVVKWEAGHSEFPHGPAYWINKQGAKVEGKLGEESNEIQAVAVGSVGGKERKETVCTVTRTLLTHDGLTKGLSNGQYIDSRLAKLKSGNESAANLRVPTKEQLEAPTVPSTPANELQDPIISPQQPAKVEQPTTLEVPSSNPAPDSAPASKPELHVQEGELVPATRPEPSRFVTAQEGLPSVGGLSLNEKTGHVEGTAVNGNGNGNGPHQTKIANMLDPNLDVEPAGAGVKAEEK